MKIMIIRYNERRVVVYHCDERRRPKTGRPRGGLIAKKNAETTLPRCASERP